MTIEGKFQHDESKGDTVAFIRIASAEQLHGIAMQTDLKHDALVANFKNPKAEKFYQKSEALRVVLLGPLLNKKSSGKVKDQIIKAVAKLQAT